MIIPQQVQDSMNHEPDDFLMEAMSVCGSLPLGGGHGDHDISEQPRRPSLQRRDVFPRKDRRWRAADVSPRDSRIFSLERKG